VPPGTKSRPAGTTRHSRDQVARIRAIGRARTEGVRSATLVGTRAALARRMDRIFYGLKRAYHSTLRISRRDFEEVDLTPARMDILHTLRRAKRSKVPIWQSQLRRIIGYTARSTMTQILQALEGLLWIRRKRSQEDKRQLEVELTDAGRDELSRAYCRFFPGWAIEAARWATGWLPPKPDEIRAWDGYVEKMGLFDRILSFIRIALRDTGSVRYRWFED
jgi:DNA-binding MarR family transcriptional regulator